MPLTIALAQIMAEKGDVPANTQKHLRMIDAAHENRSDFIFFPELSLTGYEPSLAKELAFSLTDPRLNPLRKAARQKQITVVAGAPIQCGGNLVIGSFVLFPNGTSTVYSKRYLHSGEEQYFAPHDWNPLIIHNDNVLSLAICADTTNPFHPQKAAENKTTTYVASVLWSTEGYASDLAALKRYASEYRMTTMVANYCGFTGGYHAAGQSAVIDPAGNTVSALKSNSEGILVASCTRPHEWDCVTVSG